MPDYSQLSEVMAELGPLAELLDVTGYPAEKTWTLLIDEDTVVVADLDEERNCLVLSCEVAEPLADDVAEWTAVALKYNGLWQASGGFRLGVEDDRGPFVLLLDLSASDLDASRLHQQLTRFLETLRGWRTVLQMPRVAAESAPVLEHVIRA